MKKEFTPDQFESVFEMVAFMKYSPSAIANHLKIEQSLFEELLAKARPQILEKLSEVKGIAMITGSSIIFGGTRDNESEPHQYERLPDQWKDYLWSSAPKKIRCFIECKKRDHNCRCEMKTRELQEAACKKNI